VLIAQQATSRRPRPAREHRLVGAVAVGKPTDYRVLPGAPEALWALLPGQEPPAVGELSPGWRVADAGLARSHGR